jgi:TMEM175 potassium channel family protein
VIGRYWLANHKFFALLDAIDQGLLGLNLVYLAFVAFLPFPTALLGEFFDNPLSVSVYAVAVAIVSGMEVLMFRHAHRAGLMHDRMPTDVFRWGLVQSASPVAIFLISVPVAFLSPILAVAMWMLGIPFAIVSGRFKPEGADRFFAQ